MAVPGRLAGTTFAAVPVPNHTALWTNEVIQGFLRGGPPCLHDRFAVRAFSTADCW